LSTLSLSIVNWNTLPKSTNRQFRADLLKRSSMVCGSRTQSACHLFLLRIESYIKAQDPYHS
jgi:hypothetical protein